MTTNDKSIKVLLVDDHAVVRAGYGRLLKSAPDISVAGETDSGEDAYRMVSAQHYDVVVMDLSLPGMSGLEACDRIRRRRPATGVLVFSVHEEGIFVTRALAAGAAGYLTKRAVAEVLVEAVRQVAAGRRYLDTRVAAHDSLPDPLTSLSQREFEIFRLLAEGRATPEIADMLFLSPKTVANHATRLRAKLAADSLADLTRLAIRSGVIAA